METTTLTCDICDRDIKTTGNCVDYRLSVVNERIPSKSGVVTLMGKSPILDRDFHFCSLKCLREWAKEI